MSVPVEREARFDWAEDCASLPVYQQASLRRYEEHILRNGSQASTEAPKLLILAVKTLREPDTPQMVVTLIHMREDGAYCAHPKAELAYNTIENPLRLPVLSIEERELTYLTVLAMSLLASETHHAVAVRSIRSFDPELAASYHKLHNRFRVALLGDSLEWMIKTGESLARSIEKYPLMRWVLREMLVWLRYDSRGGEGAKAVADRSVQDAVVEHSANKRIVDWFMSYNNTQFTDASGAIIPAVTRRVYRLPLIDGPRLAPGASMKLRCILRVLIWPGLRSICLVDVSNSGGECYAEPVPTLADAPVEDFDLPTLREGADDNGRRYWLFVNQQQPS